MRTKILPSDIDLSNIYEKVCTFCGDIFFTDNESCIYCKDSCKTMAYQERKENDGNVGDEKDCNTNKNIASKESISIDEIIGDYEIQINDLKELLRLSQARNKITDEEFLLLAGVYADKWFSKIIDGNKTKIITFDEIEKNCVLLAEVLVDDVGKCNESDHGFKTSNFTLKYIPNNSKGYIIGEELNHNYLLSKNL